MKDYWRRVRPEIVSGLLYWFLRAVGSTLRITVEGWDESRGPGIMCGWHGRSFVYAYRFRNLGWWVIISPSRDGEMMSRIFDRLGYRIIRGSTGRNAVRATVEAIRTLRAGGSLAMTPDGPRGPSGVCQEGVVVMAQKSGVPLVPMGVSAGPRYLAPSWDRYLIPMPFGRGIVVAGDPIYVPADADEAERERIRERVTREMNRLEEEADRRVGVH